MDLIYNYFSEEIINERIVGIINKSIEEIINISPYRVEIQPTTRCNRSCNFCSHSIRNRSGQELSQDKVLNIINELIKLKCSHVSFSGGGEPFEWQSGNLCTVVEYAAKKMDVTITTNGDGFWNDFKNKPNNLSLLNYCSNIIINTPEVDEKKFNNIVNGNGSWVKTKKIITALVDYIEANDCTCDICCVVVVTRDNIYSLNEIDSSLKNLGIQRIYYKLLKDFEENNLIELSVTKQDFENIKKNISNDATIWLKKFISSSEIIDKSWSEHCWVNKLGLNSIIDPTGNVFICTPSVGNKDYVLGNVHITDFTKLWSDKKRYDLINILNQAHVNKKCPKECRHKSHNALIENFIFDRSVHHEIIMNAGIDDVIE